MIAWPLLTTLAGGIGGIAMFYYLVNLIYYKIKSKFISSIAVQHSDETFKWVLKYLHDENILPEKSKLKCMVKKDDREWW